MSLISEGHPDSRVAEAFAGILVPKPPKNEQVKMKFRGRIVQAEGAMDRPLQRDTGLPAEAPRRDSKLVLWRKRRWRSLYRERKYLVEV